MKERFAKLLEANFPGLTESPVLMGCSGGVDSVVLTHLLHELGVDIGLAHCNYKLRGAESEGDERFVYELSKQLGVPFYGRSFETRELAAERKLSVQMTARELRYEWFDELARDFGYNFVATAHQADDDLETFLINLTRGSGLRGLSGIPVRNGRIVRPLLEFTRADIREYARNHNLEWREDSSNQEATYLRNALRLKVIPEMERQAPALQKSAARTRQHLTAARRLLDDYVEQVSAEVCHFEQKEMHLDIDKLHNYPHPELLLYELLRDFGFTDWAELTGLLRAQSGKQMFSASHRLIKDRRHLIVSSLESASAASSLLLDNLEDLKEVPWLAVEQLEQMGPAASQTAYIDLDKLEFPLEIRPWREGDSFYPLGLGGRKKLSKFFKDEKLSLLAKERVRVLCSNANVVWLIGYRLDDRYKVEPNTRKVLKLTLIQNTT